MLLPLTLCDLLSCLSCAHASPMLLQPSALCSCAQSSAIHADLPSWVSDIKGDSGIKRLKAAAAIYDLLRQWEVEVRHEAWGRGKGASGVG